MPSFVLVICVFLLVFFIATSSVADAPINQARFISFFSRSSAAYCRCVCLSREAQDQSR